MRRRRQPKAVRTLSEVRASRAFKTLQALAALSFLCSLETIASSANATLANVAVNSSPESLEIMNLPDDQPVQVPVNTVVTAKIIGSKVVGLETWNGPYFFTAPNGGGGDISATATGLGGWERFLVLYFDDGTVGLRTLDGHYAYAKYGGGSELNATAIGIGNYERFTPEWHNGRLALKTYTNNYVRAQSGGGSVVNASFVNFDNYATFNVHELTSFASEFKTTTVNLYPSATAQTKMGYPSNQPIPMHLRGERHGRLADGARDSDGTNSAMGANFALGIARPYWV